MTSVLLALAALWAQPASAFPAFPQGFEFPSLTLVSASRPLELNDPKLYPATNEFGPTAIPMGQLPIQSELVTATTKPWSSHWFPRAERDVFDANGASPLEKYDIVRATLTAKPSDAAKFEREKYTADVAKWEGLCDAWAIASILYPEPEKDRKLLLDGGLHNFVGEKITFTVGDQKALLLKTVEAISTDNLKVYGQKFLGDFEGWIYPDLLPQELHRFVEKQIFEKKQPFVMDHDPGVEVWNEPVYKANYTISAVPGRDDAVFVKLWLYSAASLRKEDKNKVGTKDVAREYNYYLYGKRDEQGNLVVDSGEWAKGDLVDSRRDHPDYVFVIPEPASVKRASNNPEIDVSIVDQILGRKVN